jgi:hypothetical protein
MSRTLLLGGTDTSWRDWLKQNRGERDHLCLDPADAVQGQPAKFSLMRRERPAWERFYGSLDPQRSPHVIVAAVVEGIEQCHGDTLVQLYAYRRTPVLRQTTQLILDLIKPDRFITTGAVDLSQFRISAEVETVELDKAFPNAVQVAQRKAQWLSLIERCEDHVVDLRQTVIEGVRLGSGEIVSEHQKSKLDLERAYVEVIGTSLLIVADDEFDERVISRAMDFTHCSRVQFVNPESYEGCLCSFAKQVGTDFGFGFVQKIDFFNQRAQIKCTAIPPVPVPTLRIGSMRIDDLGTEFPELKPWQI